MPEGQTLEPLLAEIGRAPQQFLSQQAVRVLEGWLAWFEGRLCGPEPWHFDRPYGPLRFAVGPAEKREARLD